MGGQTQLTFTLEWNGTTGDQDITKGSSWTSDNTPVATVSAGLTSGISAGSATLAVKYAQEPESVQGCGDPPTCKNPPLVSPEGNPPGTVQVPTSLSVLNVTVLPNGQGVNFGCSGLANYGILVDIKYQVLDQNGNPITSANMTPHGQGTAFRVSPTAATSARPASPIAL